jgi:hypothetical protein
MGLTACNIHHDSRLLIAHHSKRVLGHKGIPREIDREHPLIIVHAQIFDSNV